LHCVSKRNVDLFIGGDPLKQFSDLEDGKFVSPAISTKHKVSTATACAQSCLALGHCVSFNYDYGPSGTCELLRSVRQFDDTLAQVKTLNFVAYK
jgi:hypothetical protein